MSEKTCQDKKLDQVEDYLRRKYYDNADETIIYQRGKLQQLSKHLKNKSFEEATPDEILSFTLKYASTGYGPIRSCLTNFYKDLFKLEEDDKPPECIRILKSRKRRSLVKEGKEIQIRDRLITSEEYKLLIDNSSSPFQKAIIDTLYYFGPRISELLSMRATDVIMDDIYTTIIVPKSKTKPRLIKIQENPQYLIDYYNNHQSFKGNKDKPLWISPHFKSNSKNDKVMKRTAVDRMIQRIATKAGITKKITCHDFRHTAISRDLATGMPPTLVETKYGLVHNSNMIANYDHNGDKQLDDYYNKNLIDKPETSHALERKYQQEANKNAIEIINLQNELIKTNKLLNETTTDSKSNLIHFYYLWYCINQNNKIKLEDGSIINYEDNKSEYITQRDRIFIKNIKLSTDENGKLYFDENSIREFEDKKLEFRKWRMENEPPESELLQHRSKGKPIDKSEWKRVNKKTKNPTRQ
jgi:integrase